MSRLPPSPRAFQFPVPRSARRCKEPIPSMACRSQAPFKPSTKFPHRPTPRQCLLTKWQRCLRRRTPMSQQHPPLEDVRSSQCLPDPLLHQYHLKAKKSQSATLTLMPESGLLFETPVCRVRRSLHTLLALMPRMGNMCASLTTAVPALVERRTSSLTFKHILMTDPTNVTCVTSYSSEVMI